MATESKVRVTVVDALGLAGVIIAFIVIAFYYAGIWY
jgi:hypothetical protein